MNSLLSVHLFGECMLDMCMCGTCVYQSKFMDTFASLQLVVSDLNMCVNYFCNSRSKRLKGSKERNSLGHNTPCEFLG